VAEGVETSGQAALLESAGCAAMQGYWFSRPKRDLRTWFAKVSHASRSPRLAEP
jgi:EAL domain-containing protein (putative c-di-GMP-specific phosphodiesterase class I)